jgi:hypothetical protein
MSITAGRLCQVTASDSTPSALESVGRSGLSSLIGQVACGQRMACDARTNASGH